MSQYSKNNRKFRAIVRKVFGSACLCCGIDKTIKGHMTLDHVVPLARGGRHCLANCQLLCKKCNCEKGDKLVDYRKSFPLGRFPMSRSDKFRCSNSECHTCNKQLIEYSKKN